MQLSSKTYQVMGILSQYSSALKVPIDVTKVAVRLMVRILDWSVKECDNGNP
jgi:hypothetical protein